MIVGPRAEAGPGQPGHIAPAALPGIQGRCRLISEERSPADGIVRAGAEIGARNPGRDHRNWASTRRGDVSFTLIKRQFRRQIEGERG